MTKTAEDADRVRITTQFRTARGMAYDLRGAGTRVTVFISPDRAAAPETGWQIEAKTTSPEEHAEGTGATRSEALKNVAAIWSARHLPKFDWDAAAAALVAVRAL